MGSPPALVIDANLAVVLTYPHDLALTVDARIRRWIETGTEMHAPALFRYEVANSLTRLVVAGELAQEDLPTAWNLLASLPITYHSLTEGDRAAELALRLNRSSAYDAAYLLLSESLGVPLFTLDGKLARNATGSGFVVQLLDGAAES